MTLPKALALLWLAPAALLAGGNREFSLTWKDLAPLAVERNAVAVLTDGAQLKGKVLAVEPEGLRMQVTGTSRRAAWGKGETLVPRAAVTELRVSRTTKHWRAIGAAIGGGIGAPIAGTLHVAMNNEGGSSPLLALIVVVPAGLGYLAGWAADRNTVTIHLIEEK